MATEAPANGVTTTLSASITNTATTLPLTSATGFPNGQYTVLLTDGTNFELCEASAISGTNLTVARANETWGGSATAYAFAAGTKVTIVTSVQSVIRLIESYAANMTGTLAVANGGTGVTTSTGSGSTVLSTSPTLTTPNISSIVNTGTLTLPTSTDTLVGRATTDTLTNKRITKRVLALSANSATPAVNTDNYDVVHITSQTAAITGFTMSGTPVDGDTLRVSITGTAAVALTWGTSFESSTVALPTTTVTTARLDVGFFWNTETSKWRCVAVA